jgi:3-polyprenyl-4-hydroxybenzoate decarboxylase
MNSIEATLLTLINIAACMALPKLIAIFTANKTKLTELSGNSSELQTAKVKLTSFPYCTAYPLTGSQYCKFSPDFCDRCSPN